MPAGNGANRTAAVADLEAARKEASDWKAKMRDYGNRTGDDLRTATGIRDWPLPEYDNVNLDHLTVTGIKAYAAKAREQFTEMKVSARDKAISRKRNGYLSDEVLTAWLAEAGLEPYEQVVPVSASVSLSFEIKPSDDKTAARQAMKDELGAMIKEWLSARPDLGPGKQEVVPKVNFGYAW